MIPPGLEPNSCCFGLNPPPRSPQQLLEKELGAAAAPSHGPVLQPSPVAVGEALGAPWDLWGD